MNKLFITAALVLSACLWACAPVLSFAVDPTFTSSEFAEIQRAADEWNAVTKSNYKIHFDGKDWRVLKVDPLNGWNGVYLRDEHVIKIHPNPGGGSSIYAVAKHEFGHALGLKHTKTGVMMAAKVSVEFTSEVLIECRRAGACA